MSVFVIETKELISVAYGWKKIAETPILSKSSFEALIFINEKYKTNQYIHQVISEKEPIKDGVAWMYF